MKKINLITYLEGLTRRFDKDKHTIGIQLMAHAIDSKHKTSLLTARGAKDQHVNFVKEINSIVGRPEGTKDYFVNDELYSKRLDWIGNNALKKLHIIIEHLTGYRFDGKHVMGIEHKKAEKAYFYDDEEKNLRILDEPLWGIYLTKVKYYLDTFTDLDDVKKQLITKQVTDAKNHITIIDINHLNDKNVERLKEMISKTPTNSTIHFFDIDGTLTSLKLEIDILRDGKRVFVITQEELAEGKELAKTKTELLERKVKEREDYKKQIGQEDLSDVIRKAIKGEDGFQMGLDEFRDKRKINRQVANQPFIRR